MLESYDYSVGTNKQAAKEEKQCGGHLHRKSKYARQPYIVSLRKYAGTINTEFSTAVPLGEEVHIERGAWGPSLGFV